MRTLMMCGVLLALAMPARATVIVPADLAELSRDARTIVRGRVAALDAQWTEDRGTIETLVTLEVESYLKGALGQMLRFRVPGGELGRFRSIVVGAPEFVVDERVVVFLGTQGPSVPFVLGFNQGVFRVVAAADHSGVARCRRGGDCPRRSVAPRARARRIRAAGRRALER